MIEEVEAPETTTNAHPVLGVQSTPRKLSEIEGDPWERLALPMEEFSRVLGGGLVPGSLILIGGEPGIGKSTLLLQVSALLADTVGPALYVSGEESSRQIKMRADRPGLNLQNLYRHRDKPRRHPIPRGTGQPARARR